MGPPLERKGTCRWQARAASSSIMTAERARFVCPRYFTPMKRSRLTKIDKSLNLPFFNPVQLQRAG
jgi:hypothetical protein